MSQNRDKKDRSSGDHRGKDVSEHADGPGISRLDSDTLFQSVRSFLLQEMETYGQYMVPEVPENMGTADAGTQAADPAGPAAYPGATDSEPGASDEAKLSTEKVMGDGDGDVTSPAGPDAAFSNDPMTTPAIQETGNSNPAMARTLDELFEICLKADVLQTDLSGTRLVFGTGNPDADLMLIGEAPGLQEDKEGEPFVGRAGQLLNKILAAITFRREDVYIANILKHRPPNNRDPLPEERDRSLPYLYRQIELVNPKLILCLGRISAQTLLNTTEPMKNLRGRFHPFLDGRELLVTFHPAALLRNPAWKRDTWEDVQLLRKRYDELTGTGH
jgi:uracil-DNA glycosylase